MRAGLEGHLIELHALFCSQNNDRNSTGSLIGLEDLAGGNPVEAGHVEIENDDVRPETSRLSHTLLASGRSHHPALFLPKEVRKDFAEEWLVVNDEDSRLVCVLGSHGAEPSFCRETSLQEAYQPPPFPSSTPAGARSDICVPGVPRLSRKRRGTGHFALPAEGPTRGWGATSRLTIIAVSGFLE